MSLDRPTTLFNSIVLPVSSVATRVVTGLLALEEPCSVTAWVVTESLALEKTEWTDDLCPTVASPDAYSDPVTVIIPCSLSEAMVYLAPGDTKSVHQVDFADQLDVVPHKASAPMTAEDVPADEQAANQELDFW